MQNHLACASCTKPKSQIEIIFHKYCSWLSVIRAREWAKKKQWFVNICETKFKGNIQSCVFFLCLSFRWFCCRWIQVKCTIAKALMKCWTADVTNAGSRMHRTYRPTIIRNKPCNKSIDWSQPPPSIHNMPLQFIFELKPLRVDEIKVRMPFIWKWIPNGSIFSFYCLIIISFFFWVLYSCMFFFLWINSNFYGFYAYNI